MKFPRNPFTVAGLIRQCWLFVYRVPESVARPMLPAPLRLVIYGGYAFVNIVVCRLSGLRPVPLPSKMGLGYWHVAYRWHAWAPTSAGTRIEGLHFVRSDCDRWIVAKSGNLLTDFHFHRSKISVEETACQVIGCISAGSASARFLIERREQPVLDPRSPFASVADAARFLKYKPFGLSVEDPESLQVVRVRRHEADWRSRLVTVPEAQWQFLEGYDAALEVCYEVEPIEYRWERGHSVRVLPCG